MADSKEEKKLLNLVRRLPKEQARTLIEYAEFLDARHGIDAALQTPQDIPRPKEERVIAAIKRLRSTYPMLDPADLLTETSELMSKHLTQGRDAIKTINDLEKAFQSHYQGLVKEQGS